MMSFLVKKKVHEEILKALPSVDTCLLIACKKLGLVNNYILELQKCG